LAYGDTIAKPKKSAASWRAWGRLI